MNVDENEYFCTLKQGINTAIDRLQAKSKHENSRFFIRMSTRSPKDACDKPLFRQKLLSLMTQRFTNSDGSLNEEYKDLNQRLIGLRECFSKVLCASTCDQMLDLLSFSERCVSDLKRLIDHKHLLEEWNLFLVIREFEFIPICNEYRCFVHQSKLTAITQYFPHCYFPKKIKEKKEQIRKMIVDYYNNVFLVECSLVNKELTDSYILDLNVEVESGKIIIIELNPFSITTGSGFFDWTKDKDILYGDANCDYPEIRVRMKLEKHLSAVLSQWDPLLNEFERSVESGEEGRCCQCVLL